MRIGLGTSGTTLNATTSEFRGKADELRENFNSIKKDKKTIKKEPVRNEEYTN